MGEFCQKLISKYYFTAPWYSDPGLRRAEFIRRGSCGYGAKSIQLSKTLQKEEIDQ